MAKFSIELNKFEIGFLKFLEKSISRNHIEYEDIDVDYIKKETLKYGLANKISPNLIFIYCVFNADDSNKDKNIILSDKGIELTDQAKQYLLDWSLNEKDIIERMIPYLMSLSIEELGEIYSHKSWDIKYKLDEFIIKYCLPKVQTKMELRLFRHWSGLTRELYNAIRDRYTVGEKTWEPNARSNYGFKDPTKSSLAKAFIDYIKKQNESGKKATKKDFLTSINRSTKQGSLSSFFASIKDAGIVKLNKDHTYELGPKYDYYIKGELRKKKWVAEVENMSSKIKTLLRESISDNDMEEFHKLFIKNQRFGKIINLESIWSSLKSDIQKSPTPKIMLVSSGYFCGMSLNSGVYLDTSIFNNTLGQFIYIIFHEIEYKETLQYSLSAINKSGFKFEPIFVFIKK